MYTYIAYKIKAKQQNTRTDITGEQFNFVFHIKLRLIITWLCKFLLLTIKPYTLILS